MLTSPTEELGGSQVVIVDLDGTLAIRDGRGPYDYTSVSLDKPNDPVVLITQAIHSFGVQVIAVSGREDICRRDTEAWLNKHLGFSPKLFMRSGGDYRPDYEIKEEIFRREIDGKFEVLLVLDDRQQTVDMWRKLGLTTFQVAEGNF